jgi:putative ATPase
MPEARIILSQVTTYLASVPKSNAAYLAIDRAAEEVRKSGQVQVPLHLRNAPNSLMKELNYGADYNYPHDFPDHFTRQDYLPPKLKNKQFYYPSNSGREIKLKEYLSKHWPKKSEN